MGPTTALSLVTEEVYRENTQPVRAALRRFLRVTEHSPAARLISPEDLSGETYLLFLKGYDSFREGLGSLQGWIYQTVFHGLLSLHRRRRVSLKRVRFENPLTMGTVLDYRSIVPDILSLHVSDDARTLLRVLTDPLSGLPQTAKRRAKKPSRQAVRLHLSDKLGWSFKRANQALTELREAFQ